MGCCLNEDPMTRREWAVIAGAPVAVVTLCVALGLLLTDPPQLQAPPVAPVAEVSSRA